MKKMVFLVFVSALLVGCGNNIKKDSLNETERELYSILPEEYAKIGTEHNELLADFYFGKENRADGNTSTNYKDLSVEAYFGEFSERYEFNAFSAQSLKRNAVDTDCSMAQEMMEKDLISKESVEYIEQVEAVLDNLPDSLEETIEAISTVELNSLSDLDEEVLLEFISYAETAKSSLEFWSENIELLEGTENMEARGLLKNLWNKYKHKLKMMVASDAAGAAAGAVVGYGIGGSTGAAIGATIVGAASSEEGFKKDCVCIVIPLTKVQKNINK